MEELQILAVCFLLASCAQLHNARHVERMQQDRIDAVFPESSDKGLASQADNGAGFAFASYYNDHMVLQQAPQRAVVWGTYPDIGDRIIVKVAGPSRSYTYGADVKPGPVPGTGVWTVTLDPIPSGGPYSISAFADDGASISISDVLFGDVWVCSGQSNMQFSTDQIFNASKELNESSQYKDIRLFTVAMKYSAVPVPDLEAIAEHWSLPNATTVGKSPFNYFSAVCWLFGKLLYKELGYPIGLIDTTWGGTPVEAWSSPDALAQCGVKEDASEPRMHEEYFRLEGPTSNSVLWNAMVYPLLKLTVYGAIWYQGEADAGTPLKRNRYNCTFPAMIDDWRLKFSAASQQTKPDFPFGFVQLSGNAPDMSVTVGFPDIRWHQTADYGYVPNARMKNVFMSVAMDLPDFMSPWGSVHPRDKQDVAERLFMSGMTVAYNKHLPLVGGPRPLNIVQQDGYVILNYGSDSDAGIRVLSREGFEFCCSLNGRDSCTAKNAWWLPTPILSNNATSLVLDGTVCGADQFITGLRYAWRESPCVFKKCAVYSNTNDLPAPPFVTVKPMSSSPEFTYTIDWSKPQFIPQ